jgi:hypothetical protein
MGRWSEPSKKLMNSFGVELVVIPFDHMSQVLATYGVEFDWAEDDNETPKRAWAIWSALTTTQHQEIAHKILEPQSEGIRRLILEAIQTEGSVIKNVEKLELLLQTSQGEYFVKKFNSAREAIAYLLELTQDIDNVRGILR